MPLHETIDLLVLGAMAGFVIGVMTSSIFMMKPRKKRPNLVVLEEWRKKKQEEKK